MQRPVPRWTPALVLLTLAAVWLAAPARSGDGSQMGGLPRLSDEVTALRRDVLALVGRAPGCPCFDADALRALEPSLCVHETRTFSGQILGSVLRAGPFGGDPVYEAEAVNALFALVGSCSAPLVVQQLSYEAGKACGRLIEETVGPCAEVAVELR